LKLAWNGLCFVKFAPMEAKNATMEFWKLLRLLCSYVTNTTTVNYRWHQRQLTVVG